jgi:hypothetical protein
MTSATALGRVRNTTWLPATSVTSAPIRRAVLRSSLGSIAPSSVATTAQLGFLFHAAAVTFVLSAAIATGTCESRRKAISASRVPPAMPALNFSSVTKANPSALSLRR